MDGRDGSPGVARTQPGPVHRLVPGVFPPPRRRTAQTEHAEGCARSEALSAELGWEPGACTQHSPERAQQPLALPGPL